MSEQVWLYDGSIAGFLSALVRTYRERQIPKTLMKQLDEHDLFASVQTVLTNLDEAQKMARHLREQLEPIHYERILHAFLCDDSLFELNLLHYARMGLHQPKSLFDLSEPVVYAVESYQKRVLSTVHRMTGFTRFEELNDGTLYARIAPPRNVLTLLGKHFKKRFSQECFVIHDVKRELILTHKSGLMNLHVVNDVQIPERSENEQQYQMLWRSFFDSVTIDERLNLKLQRQHVPLLYREWMSEFTR